MFKKIISIVPVAALSLTVSANASTITVQKGDTLWDLAQANHTSVETIQLVNHLTTDLIHPGDVLTVAQQKQYTVKSGDTLWDIAKKYDVSISQIKEWNQLNTDLIHPDLNLVIFDGVKNSNTAVPDKSIIYPEKEQKELTSKTTVPSNNTNTKVNTPKVTVPSANSTSSKAAVPDSDASTTSNTSSKEDAPETPAKEATNVAPKETEEATPQEDNKAVQEITVEASAYTASCEGCTGITATGIDLKANPNAKVISVDPTVIPLGSNVYVDGYGEAIAGDTGGNIKGNRIDVFLPSEQEAANFGVKQLKVQILD